MALGGRTAWITGGGSGIGRAITAELAALGAEVVIFDIVVGGIEADPGAARRLRCDVADADAVRACAATAIEEMGPPDVLVNAAGVNVFHAVVDHPDELWRQVMGVNLDGAFHMMRAALPTMMERGWGRIINIASSSALRVPAMSGAYAASKAGVIALTKAVAREGAPNGVTANAIAPGLVDTPMTRASMPDDATLHRAATSGAVGNPMGVVLQPTDVAHAAAFLAAPEAAHITGQVLHVNAGSYMP